MWFGIFRNVGKFNTLQAVPADAVFKVNIRSVNSCLLYTSHYVILHSIGTDKDPENRLLVVYNYKDLRYDDINSAGKIFTMPEPVYGWPDNFVPLTD